ncbi:MAG: cytochrome c [Phycisphaerae bacterium]|nr:cytochrome c [Saprospiraceae bacterium]
MKQLFFVVSVVAALAVFTQTACYYDNEVEQYGVPICDTVSISYSADIKPIIEANCLSCHAPGGEQEFVPFDTYDGLKLFTLNHEIVDRVYGNGVNIMPPSGALSDCNKLKIEAWVNAGAPNN